MSASLAAEDIRILRGTDAFRDIGEADFGELMSISRSMNAQRGRCLFTQGESATSLYVVLDGWVTLQRDQPDGTRAVIRIAGGGEVFGEAALVRGAQYSVSADVAAEARLLRIDGERLRGLVTENSALVLPLFAAVFRQMQGLIEQIEHLKSWPIERRLARVLLRMGGQDRSGAHTFDLPVEQNLIAARLAVTPATLSRVLRRLDTVGITASRGRIAIRDRRVVARFVEGKERI